MTEWQPIETAPKDGTEIDVWCWHTDEEGYRVADAWFSVADHKWRSYADNCVTWMHQPSHWMPRPATPSHQKQTGK